MMRKLTQGIAAVPGRLATLLVTSSMLALVLLQIIAAPAADQPEAQPSSIASLLRSI